LNEAAAAVALRQVVFRWRRGHPPCLEIDHFALAAGERVFLHGPSGSGKSSLLSLIGGVALPEQGAVEVLGRDLRAMPAPARDRYRAEQVGFVFQLFNLIPYLSALDNILLPCRFAPARRAAIAAEGRSPQEEGQRLAGHLGLDPGLLARPAAELSVGQQQRVAAARALMGRPRLVVADEPTSALDAALQRTFIDLLLDECAAVGAAVLFVSHDARLMGRFDRAVALADINRARPATP
jgi:putative ABC transport system ATP-binding protein